jgi:hypothetical protein
MKQLFTLMLALIALATTNATELEYKWQTGKTYRFQAVVTDDISMNMNMMGMQTSNTDRFNTNTTFSLTVKSVDVTGKASAVLFVEAFEVKDGSGNLVASMRDIPANAVKTDVTIDKKGNFQFVKKITMVMTESGNVLVSGSAKENSVSASGQAGNTKVDVYAEVDPKTGTLKAGYSVSEVATTNTKTISIEQDSPEIDIIPYAFLELLALPEGDVTQGDVANIQAGQIKVAITAASVSGGVAALNIKTATDKNASPTKTKVDSKSSEGDFGMDMDMDNMTNDMDTEDQAMFHGGMQAQQQAMPDMTADITARFNYDKGIFMDVNGTVNTNMNMMGMEVKTKSVLGMKALN